MQFYCQRIFTALLLTLSFLSMVSAQRKENLELMSHIDFGEGGSGIWGHTDANGIEYAVIGTRQAIRILSLEDPANPVERLVIPGANNIWREARSWGNYIYVTTEGPDGITIIDATNAPESFQWKRWKPAIPGTTSDTLRTVHSINMDTLGYLYLNGHNVNRQGVIICDLNNDPWNPEIITNMGDIYTHDCYANAQYLYTADLGGGVGIYDITDRRDPKFITRFQTPNTFAHNVWTSPDGSILYTTDEVSGAYLAAYDISDLSNIRFLDKYRNEDTQIGKVIPHNTYSRENYTITSWYTDGILIHDMTRPENIVKVGEYDTFLDDASLPVSGSWFYGCWGVYAHFKSGTIIGSDINSGLWVLKPTFKRACYLEGKAFAEDKDGIVYPIAGATIKILTNRAASDITDGTGNYKTGLSTAGNYTVKFDHPDYGSKEVVVTLAAGELTIQDFVFQANFVRGTVQDELGKPIDNVHVLLQNTAAESVISARTDASGKFKIPAALTNNYQILAAAWGYKGKTQIVQNFDDVLVILESGYEDDFFADLDWKVTKNGTAGNWERVKPAGTIYNNEICNPNNDVENDLGNFAYVTGNGGVNPGDNDLDGGSTILTSPEIKAMGYDSIAIDFNYWFFNSGGNSAPNDYLNISLNNGSASLPLLNTTQSSSQWKETIYKVASTDLAFTNNMKLVIKTEDVTPGHLVEAGFDKFSAQLIQATSSTSSTEPDFFTFYPNPVSTELFIESKNKSTVVILDLMGKVVCKHTGDSKSINVSHLTSGIYFIGGLHDKAKMKMLIKL
jgi:choice-of-anchor B domain-containing protein